MKLHQIKNTASNQKTTYEIKTNNFGLLVAEKRKGLIIKSTYAINIDHAEKIRFSWFNEFWGFCSVKNLN
jgi:hypothetical protein